VSLNPKTPTSHPRSSGSQNMLRFEICCVSKYVAFSRDTVRTSVNQGRVSSKMDDVKREGGPKSQFLLGRL